MLHQLSADHILKLHNSDAQLLLGAKANTMSIVRCRVKRRQSIPSPSYLYSKPLRLLEQSYFATHVHHSFESAVDNVVQA